MKKDPNTEKPKTVELVRSDYQPTKAEKEEEFEINATMDELGDVLMRPISARWIDKPRSRRKR